MATFLWRVHLRMCKKSGADGKILPYISVFTTYPGNWCGNLCRLDPSELFADLLSFPNITYSDICFMHTDADVDGALDAFTRAWPRIETLQFVSRPALAHELWRGRRMRVNSLESLACLARRCPRLRLLNLEVDFTSFPEPVPSAKNELMHGRSMVLRVAKSQLKTKTNDYLVALARYLASIFPGRTLQMIESEHADQNGLLNTVDMTKPREKVLSERLRAEHVANTHKRRATNSIFSPRPRPECTKYTAGAHVASIPELMLPIMQQLQETAGNRALVPLTVASRFLGAIALDVLWESQSNLVPLFRVLSRVVLRDHVSIRVAGIPATQLDFKLLTVDGSKQVYDGNTKTFKMDYTLSDAEWKRLQVYASRIKDLDDSTLPDDAGYVSIDHSLLKAALQCGPLLPNLHSLYGGDHLDHFFRALSIRPEFLARADKIRHEPVASVIHICDLEQRHCLGTLFPLSRVRILTLEVDPELAILPVLRELESLESLSLAGVGEEPMTASKAAPAPGFRALRTFRIGAPDDLHSAALLLRKLSTEMLRLDELSVMGWSNENDDQAAALDFYAAVRATCDPDYLTRLSVTTGVVDTLPASELFADLLVFPNIETAAIGILHEDADVDGAVDLMTEAWPKLVEIYFVTPPVITLELEGQAQPQTGMHCGTLQALAPLARRCPRLELVTFTALDMTEVPAPLEVAEEEQMLDRRVSLYVLETEAEDGAVERAGAFLASVFPPETLVSVQTKSKAVWDRILEARLAKFQD
ncbi:hypothetical protein BD626DRAFT_568356 [Schizophyllum amplum]|uniref:Uncharacterized protein n=1 Tax=Schizophyllum amplum TaxID=97359 RepID=A0A550CIJ0_9AGAR|nr:hypothetical protein BD626DRAFT_568356 [Auriculariopsis ampla]